MNESLCHGVEKVRKGMSAPASPQLTTVLNLRDQPPVSVGSLATIHHRSTRRRLRWPR